MKDTIKRFVREDHGANMTEYALLLSLVAIAAVVGLTLLGTSLQTWFNSLGTYVGTLAAGIP